MSDYEKEELWREAKVLAQSKATAEVIRRIEQRLVDEWSNSDPDKWGARDAAYHLVRAIRTFRDELAALASEPDVTAFNRRLKGDR
jgi:hypothetical protein